MGRIAVVVGHGYGSDRGAYSKDGKVSEYDWNEDLAKRIVSKVPDAVLVYRDVPYSRLPDKINSLGVSYAIELHCNAFNTRATGTEMLYWHTSPGGLSVAQRLQKAVVDVLGLADRGVKPRTASDRGANILRRTAMPTVIVETMFIDNPHDLRVATNLKEELASSIADALNSL